MQHIKQHQVFAPKPLTAEEYEAIVMADREGREAYKRERAEYYEIIRLEGYRLAVGRGFGEDE